MKRIFTTIFTLATTIVALAQNPASTVLSTNFDAAFEPNILNPSPKGWVSANLLAAGVVTATNPGYGVVFLQLKLKQKH